MLSADRLSGTMSLRHAVLGILAREPMSGYDITKVFNQAMVDVWPARHTQIYPELSKLLQEGLIELDGKGPRGRKTYRLTEAGLEEVRIWLLRPDPAHGQRHEALLRVYFLWLLEPAEAREYMRREAEYHRAVLGLYEHIYETIPPSHPAEKLRAMVLEWGIEYERGISEWAEQSTPVAEKIVAGGKKRR